MIYGAASTARALWGIGSRLGGQSQRSWMRRGFPHGQQPKTRPCASTVTTNTYYGRKVAALALLLCSNLSVSGLALARQIANTWSPEWAERKRRYQASTIGVCSTR